MVPSFRTAAIGRLHAVGPSGCNRERGGRLAVCCFQILISGDNADAWKQERVASMVLRSLLPRLYFRDPNPPLPRQKQQEYE